MDESPLRRRIEDIERENRILRQKLESSQRNRSELEETLETHTSALKARNLELEESREKLRASEAKYREQALHDKLTELPNRSYFNQEINIILSRAEEMKRSAALLFMDLNFFKTVNDTFGHKTGDAVLAKIAKRLISCIREDDFVARIGGDEFAILLPEIKFLSDAANIAVRVIDAVLKPFEVAENSSSVGVSIGISIYPDDTNDSDKLMQYADIAMYSVKKKGENNYQFYHQLH